MLEVKIKLLAPHAKLPTYATDGSACFDIYALDGKTVFAGRSTRFKTGLSFEIPDGHVMKIFSRSGLGFNHGVRLSNSTGIIDCDYRGEVEVSLYNDSLDDYHVSKGDRICQALVVPVNRVSFSLVSSLAQSDRAGGFGSTGA